MNWLNPPPGLYSYKTYLEMLQHYCDSLSLSRNKLSVPTDPFKRKFFGNTKVTFHEDTVELEALNEQGIEPDVEGREGGGDKAPDGERVDGTGVLGSDGRPVPDKKGGSRKKYDGTSEGGSLHDRYLSKEVMKEFYD